MPTLAGAYLHAHSLRKARILSICFQYFTIWHLCTSRTHLNVAIISLFLANIWYLIKLIHSITIISRVFMFYKQRVLANCWGRKDSAICASRKRSGHYFPIWHLCTSRTPLNVAIISLFLANIWYLIKLIHSIIIILRVFMFYINSASWQTFGVEKTARLVPVASAAVHVTALSIWNERWTVCLCRPRCLFDLKSLLRRAVYKTLICGRWL